MLPPRPLFYGMCCCCLIGNGVTAVPCYADDPGAASRIAGDRRCLTDLSPIGTLKKDFLVLRPKAIPLTVLAPNTAKKKPEADVAIVSEFLNAQGESITVDVGDPASLVGSIKNAQMTVNYVFVDHKCVAVSLSKKTTRAEFDHDLDRLLACLAKMLTDDFANCDRMVFRSGSSKSPTVLPSLYWKTKQLEAMLAWTPPETETLSITYNVRSIDWVQTFPVDKYDADRHSRLFKGIDQMLTKHRSSHPTEKK